jgi:hypothetical protein
MHCSTWIRKTLPLLLLVTPVVASAEGGPARGSSAPETRSESQRARRDSKAKPPRTATRDSSSPKAAPAASPSTEEALKEVPSDISKRLGKQPLVETDGRMTPVRQSQAEKIASGEPARPSSNANLKQVRPPTSDSKLDTRLRPGVTPSKPAEATASTPRESVEVPGRLIDPRTISTRSAKPVQLSKSGAFTAGAGFRIIKVPEAVLFYQVGQRPMTWEVRDRGGRRLALIQEQEWREAMQPVGGPSGNARLGSSVQRKVKIDDWGGAPAEVVVHRFVGELYIQRLEMRPEAADWILGGWSFELDAAR